MSLIQSTLFQFSRVFVRSTAAQIGNPRLRDRYDALQSDAAASLPRARLFRG